MICIKTCMVSLLLLLELFVKAETAAELTASVALLDAMQQKTSVKNRYSKCCEQRPLYCCISGVQGATGNTGTQGDAGVTGNTGATGAQGATGNTGAAGSRGNTGVAGSTGPQGAKGSTGATGPKGDAGERGVVTNSIMRNRDGSPSTFYVDTIAYNAGGVTFRYPEGMFQSTPFVYASVVLKNMPYSQDLKISPLILESKADYVTLRVNKQLSGFFTHSVSEVADQDILISIMAISQ